MIPFKTLGLLSAIRTSTAPVAANIANAIRQYRNSELDEVTGQRATLLGTATMEGSRFRTLANRTSGVDFGYFNLAEGEDVTLEGKMNIISMGGNGGFLFGAWNQGGSSNNGFTVSINPSRGVSSTWSSNGTAYGISLSSANNIVQFGQDLHIAVVRKSGVIKIFLNGKVVATGNYNGPIYQTTLPVTTSWVDANGWINGTRWDIRMVKRAMYDEEFTPEPLGEYLRGTYDQETASKIILQYTGRENTLVEEAKGRTVALTNTTISNGQILSVNTVSSYYRFPSEYFGAGDFTIECDAIISAVNATYGTVIVGQWRAGGQNDQNNRWSLYLGPSRTFNFSASRSATANDFVSLASDTPILFNTLNRFIIERVNGVLTLYLNGKAVGTSTAFNFPLRTTTSGYHVRSLSDQNAYSHAGRVSNIRIADKAMYNGNVLNIPSSYPAMP